MELKADNKYIILIANKNVYYAFTNTRHYTKHSLIPVIQIMEKDKGAQ